MKTKVLLILARSSRNFDATFDATFEEECGKWVGVFAIKTTHRPAPIGFSLFKNDSKLMSIMTLYFAFESKEYLTRPHVRFS